MYLFFKLIVHVYIHVHKNFATVDWEKACELAGNVYENRIKLSVKKS